MKKIYAWMGVHHSSGKPVMCWTGNVPMLNGKKPTTKLCKWVRVEIKPVKKPN